MSVITIAVLFQNYLSVANNKCPILSKQSRRFFSKNMSSETRSTLKKIPIQQRVKYFRLSQINHLSKRRFR